MDPGELFKKARNIGFEIVCFPHHAASKGQASLFLHPDDYEMIKDTLGDHKTIRE